MNILSDLSDLDPEFQIAEPISSSPPSKIGLEAFHELERRLGLTAVKELQAALEAAKLTTASNLELANTVKAQKGLAKNAVAALLSRFPKLVTERVILESYSQQPSRLNWQHALEAIDDQLASDQTSQLNAARNYLERALVLWSTKAQQAFEEQWQTTYAAVDRLAPQAALYVKVLTAKSAVWPIDFGAEEKNLLKVDFWRLADSDIQAKVALFLPDPIAKVYLASVPTMCRLFNGDNPYSRVFAWEQSACFEVLLIRLTGTGMHRELNQYQQSFNGYRTSMVELSAKYQALTGSEEEYLEFLRQYGGLITTALNFLEPTTGMLLFIEMVVNLLQPLEPLWRFCLDSPSEA